MQFYTLVKLAFAAAQVGLVMGNPASLAERQISCALSFCGTGQPACADGTACFDVTLGGSPLPLPDVGLCLPNDIMCSLPTL
ncbi:hypothetical protein FKP32DRAFT_1682818 [Trametes sanguinea]|nr:hypothetical protein FKP32DRAFT_1682818 [Trametes sanguinea]